jgi:hypothetical protein
MRSRINRWLVALCDPQGLADLPAGRMPLSDVVPLMARAEQQGVGPVVLANLERWAQTQSIHRKQCASAAPLAALLAASRPRILHQAGLALMLRAASGALVRALAAARVPATVLKGTDFADRLYPVAALRPQRDVDLLVPRDALATAEAVLGGLGYAAVPDPPRKYKDGYGQRIWRRDDAGAVVELHWNLVNSPAVRRGISVLYEDLTFEPAVMPGSLPRLTAASCVLLAAVHGATSHSFERLQLLCDIRQLARGAAGPIDTAWLADAASRTGSLSALGVALRLTAQTLRCPSCSVLCQSLGPRLPSRWSWVLTPAVVLGEAPLGAVRRQLFRHLQKNPPCSSL